MVILFFTPLINGLKRINPHHDMFRLWTIYCCWINYYQTQFILYCMNLFKFMIFRFKIYTISYIFTQSSSFTGNGYSLKRDKTIQLSEVLEHVTILHHSAIAIVRKCLRHIYLKLNIIHSNNSLKNGLMGV